MEPALVTNPLQSPPQTTGAVPTRPRSNSLFQMANMVASTGVVLGLSFLTNLLASRVLDPTGRGMLAAGLQVGFFTSALLLLGLERSLPVVLNERPMAETIPYMWVAYQRRAMVLLVLATAATIFGLFTDFGWVSEIAVFGLPAALMAVATMLEVTFRTVAVNGGRSQKVLQMATTIGLLILVAAGAFLIGGVTSIPIWLLAYALSRGVIAGFFLLLAQRSPSDRPSEFDGAKLGELRSVGWRLWPSSFANFAAFRSDRILMPVLATSADLGVYVMIATLIDVAMGPTEAAANVLNPRWRTAALQGKLRTTVPLLLAVAYLSAAALFMIVAGQFLVTELFGADFRPDFDVVFLLTIASAVFGFNRLLMSRATAKGFTTSVSVAETIGMAVALVGYLVLIPIMTQAGAALGALIGYSTTTLALLSGERFDRWAKRQAKAMPLKRGFDCVAAGSVMLLISPILFATALGIRVFLGKGVLFRQQRTGYGGHPFNIIKFRTMLNSADATGMLLPDAQRRHWFGSLLRKTSLDELPTLWNIVRGDMSIVGPRPLLHRYLTRYSQEQLRRFEVRPGLTGWAQVQGRNAVGWDDRLRFDVEYVENQSLIMDLKVIWLTVKLVATGSGADGVDHTTEFMGSDR